MRTHKLTGHATTIQPKLARRTRYAIHPQDKYPFTNTKLATRTAKYGNKAVAIQHTVTVIGAPMRDTYIHTAKLHQQILRHRISAKALHNNQAIVTAIPSVSARQVIEKNYHNIRYETPNTGHCANEQRRHVSHPDIGRIS